MRETKRVLNCLVNRQSLMAHGSRLTAHGSWLMAHGSRLTAHGSWLMAHGSWLMAHGSWLMAHGSWLMALFFMSLPSARAQSSSYDILVGLYVKTYSSVALQEMNQYHIPASITLAQGIIESKAGQSKLAKEANNHFGIKCHKDWAGKTYLKTDDHANECFRKYDHDEESFRDHSWFLTQGDRYKGLFKLQLTDYHGWAEGLEAAGYATNKQYAEMLIRTIDDYQLYLFDRPDYAGEMIPSADQDFARYAWIAEFKPDGYIGEGRRIYENNELQCIVVRSTDNLSKLSTLVDIPVKRLMKYNDLVYMGSLEAGQVLYIEPKRRRGSVKSHIVQAGETLYEISQHYGIKMKLLLKRSGMAVGMDPYPGQVLPLR